VNDASKPLTLTEWKMLRTLARGFGRTIEHAEMLRFVWGDDFLEEIHLLRVNMTRLRAKLEPNDAQRFITTIPCIGYQLGTPADRRALEQEQGLASP
jgi:DNA-binding response OmpR family regulator